MNILFCTLSYYPARAGGSEHQARLQARELVHRGHSVTVVCPRVPDTTSGWVEGVRVVRLRRIDHRPFRLISYLCALSFYLLWRGRRYDLIHVHIANPQADVVGLLARLLQRPTYVKVAAGGSGGEVRRLAKVSWITRWYGLRHASCVQCLSPEIEGELNEIGVPTDRIVPIPNGIDLERFRPRRPDEQAALRQRLDLPEDALVVLFVGRFAIYKGVQDLLDAWAKLDRKGTTLLLVGTQAVDKPAGPLQLNGSVQVRDWTSAVPEYLRAADIYVHPAHIDGMSNALLEAMACGLPLVATRLQAVEGLISDGQEGVLVQPQDPTDLRNGLRRLIDDEDLRSRLARNASVAAQRYEITKVVDEIERVYGRLTAT